METFTPPWNWKHLLIKALESNSHLQHSSFFYLVCFKHSLSNLYSKSQFFFNDLLLTFYIWMMRYQATVDCNGRPSNRTVVFRYSPPLFCFLSICKLNLMAFWVYRGFVEDSDKIQINTDGRSRKVLLQLFFHPLLLFFV